MYSLRAWQTLPKDKSNFIVQASTQDGLDRWTEFPIGMGWGWVSNSHISFIGPHSKTVLCAVSINTDKHRRRNGYITRSLIVNKLAENGIQNKVIPQTEYFQSIASYKFVVSPEGNGIDCHRHYEALMAGCIPIVERNPLTEKKYKGCPILWTTDYSEITEDYLNQKYEEMIDKQYDFSCLFLSSYPPIVQRQIRDNGAYWTKKLTGEPFYKNKLLPFLRI